MFDNSETRNTLGTKVVELTGKNENAKKDINKLKNYMKGCDENKGECSKKIKTISKYVKKINADLL
jgi:hypothetical protein